MSVTTGVSVVIPTYNRAELVCDAVSSALAQTWDPLEVVVVDNASTDDTAARLESLAADDARVRYIRRETNGGQAASRNDGIRAARYDYVALLDSDDYFLPGKLERQMPPLLERVDRAVSFTAYMREHDSDARNVVLEGWSQSPVAALERLLESCCLNTSTLVAPRDVLLSAGLFRSIPTCEDHDLWLRLAIRGYPFLYEAQPLTVRRVQTGSISADEALLARFSEFVINEALEERGLPIEVRKRRRSYQARWALNSAVRYLAAGDARAALKALGRAARADLRAVRPGWLLMAMRAARGIVLPTAADTPLMSPPS